DYGFRVRPDGLGGLHAEFKAGGVYSGAHYLATLANGQWTWKNMGYWNPNTGDGYAGIDELNRGYSLIHDWDWDPGPMTFLQVSEWEDVELGTSHELGRVAAPARPVSGGIPIALLRQQDQGLEFLAVHDGDDFSVNTLANTERLSGLCPNRYRPVDGACPQSQCTSSSSGVEEYAYQLARTSGGPVWAAWLLTDADIEVEYSLSEGSSPLCQGTVISEVSGTLHLAELAEDGTTLRSLELP